LDIPKLSLIVNHLTSNQKFCLPDRHQKINCQNLFFYSEQWWSLETWSRSRDSSRDPFLRVSVSKFSGLDSVSKATSLETLNIAKKLFSKISTIQRFFVCCIFW